MTSIYAIVNHRGFWHYFIKNYINNETWISCSKTSKIFHILNEKDIYLKYHKLWKKHNLETSIDIALHLNAFTKIPYNNGHIQPDARWNHKNGQKICSICKCLETSCDHVATILDEDNRIIYLSHNIICEWCNSYICNFFCKTPSRYYSFRTHYYPINLNLLSPKSCVNTRILLSKEEMFSNENSNPPLAGWKLYRERFNLLRSKRVI
jgi:hypothetical protein